MLSYTVMLIDLVDLPYSGQRGQQGQYQCAESLYIKTEVYPLADSNNLHRYLASRVPAMDCGWENLSLSGGATFHYCN